MLADSPPKKHDVRQEGRKFGGRSSFLSSGRGLGSPIRWLGCFRLKKKPPDQGPAALSRVRVIVSAVKRRRESTARFAEIHLEVAEIDLGIALALVHRLLEHFGPASRVAVEPILAEPLVLALAVDAAIGVRQGV